MRDGTKTRESIEKAAIALFVEKGIAGTSIRDIAGAAGVSEGALYRHFEGKEVMARTIFQSRYLDLTERLDDVVREGRGLRGRLFNMIELFADLFDDDPVLFSFLLLTQHEHLTALPKGVRTPLIVIQDVLVEAAEAGETRIGNPELATATVMGIVLQTATFRVYGRIATPMRELVGELTETCCKAVGDGQ